MQGLTGVYNLFIAQTIRQDDVCSCLFDVCLLWKLARVTPIFKTGSKKDANNCRPISVISVFSRMLEKIVHDQLIEYLITNKVSTPNQSAFRKLYSTVTSLINSTDYWYDNMDKKQLNLAIFLDLKKAFDTVDHRILIKKLGAYGIRGISGVWGAIADKSLPLFYDM